MQTTLLIRHPVRARAPLATLATLVALALAFFVGVGSAAAEAPLPAAPTRWVTDPAGFLSPSVAAQLDARLAAVQRQSGHQVIVWIGRTINGAALDDWAVRTFAAWKVGRKGIDDGLVMFVLAEDRTVDIEVGYGLEGQISDAVAARIIREVVTPRLRAGDRDGAITAGTEALLQALQVAGVQPAVSTTGPTGPAIAPNRGLPSWPKLILYGLLALGFLVLMVTHPRLAMFFLWNILSGGRGGGGGGGDGGFGGGGGRSGGGGARGSW